MYTILLIPLVGALIALILPSDRFRPHIVAASALIHLICTFRLRIGDVSNWGWLAVDSLGYLVLMVLSILFALCCLPK